MNREVSRKASFFNEFVYLFIYFWLRWVFLAVRGLSPVGARGGYSSLQCAGFSLRWLLFLQSTGSRRMGFSSCGARAQYLWRTGLAAPQLVGSSWTTARTHVLCIGRWILFFFFFFKAFFFKFFNFIYIYFWLCWVFVSVRGLSLVVASGGHSSSRCAGPLTVVASLVAERQVDS